jgi:tetratricopeptide (TPR) repeat protein
MLKKVALICALAMTVPVTGYGAQAAEVPSMQGALVKAHRLMCAGEFGYAKEIVGGVLKVDPDHAEARQYLAICLYNEGLTLEALKLLNWRVTSKVATAIDHLYIGHAHFSTGNVQTAINAYTAALQADPHLAEAYSGLAKSYSALGQYQHAKTIRARAMQYGCRIDMPETYSLSGLNVGS